MSLFSQWYFTLSGWSRNKNLWEIVASSPFPPPLAASPLAQVFSRGLLCSLSRLASLAITGELAHRLMKIRHCVPAIKLIQCTGLYSTFLEHSIQEPKSSPMQITWLYMYTQKIPRIFKRNLPQHSWANWLLDMLADPPTKNKHEDDFFVKLYKTSAES